MVIIHQNKLEKATFSKMYVTICPSFWYQMAIFGVLAHGLNGALDSSLYKTTEKFEHEIENRRHLSVTRESCPVRPLKPRPALGRRVK